MNEIKIAKQLIKLAKELISEDILEEALNNKIDTDEIIEQIKEMPEGEEVLKDFNFSSKRTASHEINASIMDKLNKYSGNAKLFSMILALLLTSGQLFGYTVKEGDTLWSIAQANGCKLEQIYGLNPGIKKIEMRLPIGKEIILPNEVKTVAKKSIQTSNQTLNIDAALKALREIESNNGTNIIGDGGKAIGDYQLWEIFVEDYHRLGGKKEYKCNVVNGVAQKDDVRFDRNKCEEMIRYVFKRYGYKSMEEVLKGFGSGKTKRPGWNSKVSDKTLKKYVDAYNKYNK